MQVQTNDTAPQTGALLAAELVDEETYKPTAQVDTSEREPSGGYARHITQSLPAPDGLDLREFLEPAKAA